MRRTWQKCKSKIIFDLIIIAAHVIFDDVKNIINDVTKIDIYWFDVIDITIELINI